MFKKTQLWVCLTQTIGIFSLQMLMLCLFSWLN